MAGSRRDIPLSFEEAWRSGGETKIAQDLLIQLKEIRDHREGSPARRWVWELVQNALDVANPEALHIEFEFQKEPPAVFTFRHDGRPFQEREVAALVQSWSTKREPGAAVAVGEPDDQEGKFGEGFLQSHSISERIVVSGTLEGGESFRFLLDRTGKTRDEVMAALKGAKQEFQKSRMKQEREWSTQFEYHSLDAKGLEVVSRGLEELDRATPLVVALSPKPVEIKMITPMGTKSWKRRETRTIEVTDGTLEFRSLSGEGSSRCVAAVRTTPTAHLAVLGEGEDPAKPFVVDAKDVPKVFSHYPLWGTREIGCLVVVDARFETHRDRSGPALGSGDDGLMNKQLLSRALDYMPDFIGMLSRYGWGKPELAARVCTPNLEGDVAQADSASVTEMLKRCVVGLAGQPLVHLEDSGRAPIPPMEAAIPFSRDAHSEGQPLAQDLWELLRQLFPDRVVARSCVESWTAILNDWMNVSDQDYHWFGGVALTDVIEEVRKSQNIPTLTVRLGHESSATLRFLESLYRCALRQGLPLKDLGILPNADGRFVDDLYLNPGIDSELLAIAESLDLSPRGRLLHPDVAELAGFPWDKVLKPYDAGGLEGHILEKIQSAEDKKSILTPSAQFLKWLVRQGNRAPLLRAFPFVFASATGEKVERPYFTPRSLWDADAQPYAGLFDLATLADGYGEVLEGRDWQTLHDLGIVTTMFVREELVELSGENRKALLAEPTLEDVKKCKLQTTQMTAKVVPNLSFLLHERARRSRENSLDCVIFALRHLVHLDDSWRQSIEIYCDHHARLHKFRKSHWLAMLKEREWVWEGKDQQDKPSSQNLKDLLRATANRSLLEALGRLECRDFLSELGLPPHELALALATRSADEENSLGDRIFEVVQPLRDQPEALSSLASLAQKLSSTSLGTLASLADDSGLVADLEEMASRRDRVKGNQALGKTVEELVKRLLKDRESRGRKLIVDGVIVGADAAVKVVAVTEEGATLELANLLVEIKSTTEDRVRLTPSQVEAAVTNRGTFFLCIVPLEADEDAESLTDEEALRRILIVPQVADQLDPRFREVKAVKDSSSGNEVWVDNLRSVRYAVEKQVWKSAGSLENWIDQLLGGQADLPTGSASSGGPPVSRPQALTRAPE